MKQYLKDKISNYNKTPFIEVKEKVNTWIGWKEVITEIERAINLFNEERSVIAIETYPGVNDSEIITVVSDIFNSHTFIYTNDLFKSEDEIIQMSYDDVTDDEIFGVMTRLVLSDYFDPEKLKNAREKIENSGGLIIVYGTGATLVTSTPEVLVYADMTRWEIQQRFRRNEASNLGLHNNNERTSLQYKRAFFVDWRVSDQHKKEIFDSVNYFLDTNKFNQPKMISGETLMKGFELVVGQPFRVVPFFDPGPWGGQWMKEICDLDKSEPNFAWCFDCVPEENSLLLKFGDTIFETPSINLVFFRPVALLGDPVHARFGDEFPIRFDLLDTMKGGNLSLQVHPLTEYIQEKFGMHYTQDESYYILDAEDDAFVYLGLRDDIEPEKMIIELQTAQKTGLPFDADKHVQKWEVKKHDHVLIPAGTVHCSGKNSMVLEISATPYIFTFKLWDWGRLGLDGRPRPINIEHGKKNIQWARTREWSEKNIRNRVEKIGEGDGWIEEKTGLHEREFIETRRHWFSKTVLHDTGDSVNVLNLVEGREVIVESPNNSFEPFVVHYAETFIVPANVKSYTIRPFGESEGQECATIKAFVRH
ncbi:mannose-6-phosphate isomerase [Maribellus luteus]|uniref:Mannose-6-phosphate isomerase n=1 Tax=Maribellus luteus TaxID=2305463 RepID=A0A399TA32_9BACT|nr:class I mannose-6-phosphate isomerase [Maribellus luteus]RIJ50823.1 mannose-6-phosphate isomerase [Maribellus luteus]